MCFSLTLPELGQYAKQLAHLCEAGCSEDDRFEMIENIITLLRILLLKAPFFIVKSFSSYRNKIRGSLLFGNGVESPGPKVLPHDST